MNLVNIDFVEFKKEIYPYYLELFPENEQKTLKEIRKPYQKEITKLVKIVDDEKIVGFLIYNTLPNNQYVQLDYFAIFPSYQNQNYGSKAINEFKTFFNDYNGIYGEVEKPGLGKDEQENLIRERRIKFWKSLGFEFLDLDLELFHVVYSPCILKTKDIQLDVDEIMDSAFSIYRHLLGEERVKKNCHILRKK